MLYSEGHEVQFSFWTQLSLLVRSDQTGLTEWNPTNIFLTTEMDFLTSHK